MVLISTARPKSSHTALWIVALCSPFSPCQAITPRRSSFTRALISAFSSTQIRLGGSAHLLRVCQELSSPALLHHPRREDPVSAGRLAAGYPPFLLPNLKLLLSARCC